MRQARADWADRWHQFDGNAQQLACQGRGNPQRACARQAPADEEGRITPIHAGSPHLRRTSCCLGEQDSLECTSFIHVKSITNTLNKRIRSLRAYRASHEATFSDEDDPEGFEAQVWCSFCGKQLLAPLSATRQMDAMEPLHALARFIRRRQRATAQAGGSVGDATGTSPFDPLDPCRLHPLSPILLGTEPPFPITVPLCVLLG